MRSVQMGRESARVLPQRSPQLRTDVPVAHEAQLGPRLRAPQAHDLPAATKKTQAAVFNDHAEQSIKSAPSGQNYSGALRFCVLPAPSGDGNEARHLVLSDRPELAQKSNLKACARQVTRRQRRALPEAQRAVSAHGCNTVAERTAHRGRAAAPQTPCAASRPWARPCPPACLRQPGGRPPPPGGGRRGTQRPSRRRPPCKPIACRSGAVTHSNHAREHHRSVALDQAGRCIGPLEACGRLCTL